MPRALIEDIRTIGTDAAYHGWPTVGRRADGELLVVCSGGREAHVCPYGKLHLTRSRDDGATWSDPAVLADGPFDDRDAGVLETSRGTILVNWFTSAAWIEWLYRHEVGELERRRSGTAWSRDDRETLTVWSRRRHDLLASGASARAELGDWMLRSTDGGATWSPRYATGINSPHGPIQLANGHLLYAGKRTGEPGTWKHGNSHHASEIGVSVSTDDGVSWQWQGPIPAADGHRDQGYQELHAVEAANGDLVVQIRNANPPHEGETLQAESSDGGATWRRPHGIDVWGLPSHLLRLRDDRLLMTYGHRRKPFGNQARISADHGRTWSPPMTLSDDGIGPDLGYPSSVQLADGRILSVWYEVLADHPHAVLRQARWQVAS